MNLTQLLSRLALGPVGDLAIGGDRSGVIPLANVPEMLAKAQEALTELHTRFALSRKRLQLELVDGVTTYPLQEAYAQSSGSTEINKFIKDTVAAPYTGDLLLIEHVLDSDLCELPLNARNDCVSWHTSAYDTLTMDYPGTGDIYYVEYRADHAPLDIETMDQLVRLPRALEPALMAKIAHLVFSKMTGENSAIKSAEMQGIYEKCCTEVQIQNAANTSVIEDRSKYIEQGGWV